MTGGVKLPWCLVVASVMGCGEESEPAVDPAPPAGCVPGERVLDDGSCRPAGIPAYGCGEGFEHDGDRSCEPILPAAPCPFGTMAVPGEVECREIAPCGDGPWGAIPIEASTQHVDQSHAGPSSDGSSAMPWTTITEAIEAAAPGAIVAVAPGTYLENLAVVQKPVRLWGKCPAEVEVVAADSDLPVLRIVDGAHGTEVRALAMGGSLTWPAVGMAACEDVVLSQVWIHDNGTIGLMVDDQVAPSSATLADSLVEVVGDVGIVVFSSVLTVERSVVRDTSGGSVGLTGRGIDVESRVGTGNRAAATMSQSVLERTQGTSLFVGDAEATVVGSVIVDAGFGNQGHGYGRGIGVEDDGGRSSCSVRQSLVARARGMGIYAASSDLWIDLSVVRDTLPRELDLFGGRGINVETAPGSSASTLVLASSLVERSAEVGVVMFDGVATIESTLVRDTSSAPVPPHYGVGVTIQQDPEAPLPGIPELAMRWSEVDGSQAFGLVVQSASATLESVRIAHSQPVGVDQLFGDSVAVSDVTGPAWLAVASSRLEQSARAGVAMFGGTAHLAGTKLECNAIHLTGQPYHSEFQLIDEGGNSCGCGQQVDGCSVVTVDLAPPEPVGTAGE